MSDRKKLADSLRKECALRDKFLRKQPAAYDFRSMCQQIAKLAGVSKCGIERVLDCGDGWVHRIVQKPKRRPIHDTGERLIALWELVTGKDRSEAPRK